MLRQQREMRLNGNEERMVESNEEANRKIAVTPHAT
jgi:hypothetical protein